MDFRGGHYVSCAGYVDYPNIRMSSPTCEDLGIPNDLGEEAGVGAVYPLLTRRIIHNPSLHLDGLRYEAGAHKITDPYSPLCMIPLPGALSLHAATEPSFIRKRNERERERVRCVNEGYERLKEHLPNASKDKRISKVETLRGAIDYIRKLQQMLEEAPPLGEDSRQIAAQQTQNFKLHMKSSTQSAGLGENNQAINEGERGKATRRGSVSSEQSALSDGTLSESEDEHFVKRRRLH